MYDKSSARQEPLEVYVLEIRFFPPIFTPDYKSIHEFALTFAQR